MHFFLSSAKARLLLCASLAAFMVVIIGSSSARASLSLKTFDVTFLNEDGSPDTQAGSHPYEMRTAFELGTEETVKGIVPDEPMKDLEILEVPGFVGDPAAAPTCSAQDFTTLVAGPSTPVPNCADATAVGVAKVKVTELGSLTAPVYNLQTVPGRVTKLGFYVAGAPVLIEVGVNGAPPHNLIISVRNISQILEFLGGEVKIWGVPANRSHDKERGVCADPGGGGTCPAGVKETPFLTLPRACNGPLSTDYEADSWIHPGSYLEPGSPNLADPNWFTGSVLTHDGGSPSNPQGMTGCSKLAFTPGTSAKPTTVAASSPTGLDFGLDVNDEGLKNPAGLAQSDIKKVVVALPEAMSVNPALAEGLNACSEADLARETVNSNPGEGCPDESKIGNVEVETPLLTQTLKGSLFLASPYSNPFGSLLALYVVIKDPETGILIKIPGRVEPNPTTGQLVSVFDNLPELPFSHFRLSFRQGQRSPLVTPPACGTYTTQAELTPAANPTVVLHDNSTFQVTTGIGGTSCPAGGVPPFNPGLIAGTTNSDAGSYSPLYIRITRNDGEQEITGFSSLLPAGVTANLNGVPFCTEGQIAQARTKSGAQEQSEPSCPGASEIGHTLVGVGVGSVLAYTPGKLYMAGPFEGAPFSVVAITSAKVGPFDLGTVIVHLPLNIDPVTAQVSIPAGAADQIPHIVKGIVVHVRDIRVYVDRPNFTKNPTNCAPLTFGASVIGAGENLASPSDDVTASVNNPFQAADCANLAFKPSFSVTTSGKTSKANGASLAVKLAFPNAPQGSQSNIRQVKVELPKQLPSRLTTLQKACTAAQFHTNPAGCPAASVVGHAKAITPILPVPIEGPVYFVSNGGEAFPNLIMVLQGYGVTIDLVGNTFISKTGITSSTFKTVPDQPVSSFELVLPQGPYSALTANGNLCTSKLSMPTEFVGQNGALLHQATKVNVTGCPKAKVLTRAQKLAIALKACHKKHGNKRKACVRAARKKYGPIGKKAKRAKRPS
jgi:hypothetical protein